MHLMIPHASALDEAARHALSGLALPHLRTLLGGLIATDDWGSDEFSADPPHDIAQAALRGQARPSAAAWLAGDSELAWAELTPVHLAVGSDGVDLLPPAALRLSPAEGEAFAALLQPLWPASEGWQWRLMGPTTWLIGHAHALDGLSAASIERVAGRPIEPWLPESRVLRRWQNEAQMLLHGQPLNAEREAQGRHAVNSVWIGGIGRAAAADAAMPAGAAPVLDRRLTEPLLNGDLEAWVEAWSRLDAERFAAAPAQALSSLTLCGERRARRFERRPLSLGERLRRRLRPFEPLALLEAL